MLRRSCLRRGYLPPDPTMDPSHYNSPFGWHYLLPQVMHAPHTVNRTAPQPQQRKKGSRAFHSVWIEAEMHPAFRVALDPFLRKLPMTRFVPNTKMADVAADYATHAHQVGHVPSRHAWLAKVAQHGGVHGSCKEVLSLWNTECQAMYMTGTAVPPAALAQAMIYCTAAARAPEFATFFRACLKDKWNLTPTFTTNLWNSMLTCAGYLDDEATAMLILEEMIDVQANLNAVRAVSLVRALNAIKSKEYYERVKKLLFVLSVQKMNSIFFTYTSLRSSAELQPDDNHPFPVNDNMFYHVHWHNRIRGPQRFNPRQLYFDYTPSTAVTDNKFTKKTGDEIVAERLAKWKEEGLVPQDYVETSKFVETSEKFKFFARQERWKKKPTFWESRPGWTPHEG